MTAPNKFNSAQVEPHSDDSDDLEMADAPAAPPILRRQIGFYHLTPLPPAVQEEKKQEHEEPPTPPM